MKKSSPKSPAPPASPELFDRQLNESARAYEAFRIYIEMGADRSAEAVCQKLRKSRALMLRWSARWRWVERANSYDAFISRKRAEAEAAALKERSVDWAARQQKIREDYWALGEALKAKAHKILEWPISQQTISKDGKTIHIHPANFSVHSAARLADVANDLQRLAAGMATGRTEITGAEGTPLPAAQPAQLVIFELPNNGRDQKEKEDDEPEPDKPGKSK